MTTDQPRWALLRVWHFEAMNSVIANPDVAHFTRTSYLTAPSRWRELPLPALASRVEQVLVASYKQRAAQLRTPDDPASLVPFAFFFEWVDRDDIPANPAAQGDPFLYPCVAANPALGDIAYRDLDAIIKAARPGIASRCYDDAFSAFRIDENDSWHLVPYRDREALFEERHVAPHM